MATLLKDMSLIMVRAYLAKANLLMLGQPGIGKTCSIEAFAEKMRERVPEFKVWHFYGPTMSPMDIQASMPDNATNTLKVYSNACLPNAYTEPDVKGVVFVGEMLNTDPTTLKLLQKYVNGEDMNGCLKKPHDVMVIADSNRLEDKAGVVQQFRALLNRFLTIDVYTNEESNIEYAAKHNWHPLVQAFFRENPHLIDNYAKVFSAEARKDAKNEQMGEEGKKGIWACMRGWDRISSLEFAAEELGMPITNDEIVGSVGTGPGMQYLTFKKVVGRLATIEQVLANPEKVAIPEKIDELYALAMIVSLRCKPEDLKAVHTFAQRIQMDMQAFMIKTIMGRKGFPLVGTETYRTWILNPQLNKLITAR